MLYSSSDKHIPVYALLPNSEIHSTLFDPDKDGTYEGALQAIARALDIPYLGIERRAYNHPDDLARDGTGIVYKISADSVTGALARVARKRKTD